MDKRDLLKSVLQNFINDKTEEAQADFHKYLTIKSKEVTGIGVTPVSVEPANTDTQTAATPTPEEQQAAAQAAEAAQAAANATE